MLMPIITVSIHRVVIFLCSHCPRRIILERPGRRGQQLRHRARFQMVDASRLLLGDGHHALRRILLLRVLVSGLKRVAFLMMVMLIVLLRVL